MNLNASTASHPTWPVNVMVVMIFLMPAIGMPSELVQQDTLKSAIAAIGILFAAVLYTYQPQSTIRFHGLLAIPVVLALFALVSMAWSYTYLAGVEAARWVLLSILMWLCTNALEKHHINRFLWCLHCGVSAASVWTLTQFLLNLQFFPQASGAEPASTFANRNFFAEYAISALPLSIWLLVRTQKLGISLFLAATLSVNIVALLMTGTRSALLSLFIVSCVVAVILIRYRHQLSYYHWPRVQKVSAGLMLVFGIIALGSLPSARPSIGVGKTALVWSSSRVASIAQPNEYTDGSFSIRMKMWKTTARMILANPWFGVGAGAWEIDAPLYQNTVDGLEIDFYAHNEFLQLLSEYGLLIGGSSLAFLLAYLIKSTERVLALGTCNPDAPMHAFILSSILALLLVSNAGFPLHLASTGTLLALYLGLLVQPQSIHVTVPRHIHRCLFIFLATSLGVAAYISLQAMRSESKLIQSIHLGNTLIQASEQGTPPNAQSHQHMLDEAIESLSINPHPRNLVAMVAEQLEILGDLPHATQIAEILASAHPHVPTIRAKLALAYSRLLEHGKAWEHWKVLQGLEPNSLRTQEIKLILLLNEQRIQEAATQLDQYLKIGITSPTILELKSIVDSRQIHGN